MIKAIFYSKFDTIEGPKVVHQVPDGAIVPSPNAPSQPPFLTFSDISFFVIPRQELCGNLLQVCTNGYRILGYPICMKSVRYDRNEFIFNFCIVLAEEEDFSTYKSVVQKLADLMHGLEEQNGFLSRDFSKSGEGKVHSLCEMLMEDLNNYCECMIPIDELNTLNIKLFPIYPSPPPVKAWQVPLFTLRYQAFMDENWDLTMQRIVPHINGVNSVRIISVLADTDFSLTCRALRHLLYYGCLFILDIFSLRRSNATRMCPLRKPTLRTTPTNRPFLPSPPTLIPTPSANGSTNDSTGTAPLSSSLTDPSSSLTREESRFDAEEIWPLLGADEDPSTSTSTSPTTPSTLHKPAIVDGAALVELYASLKQGQSVKQWYAAHSRSLANIDIRRFITFGVIKGFLYRVHKYACATSQPAPPPRASSFTPTALSSRGTTGNNTPYAVSSVSEDAPISAAARRESSRERAGSVVSGGRNGNGTGTGSGGPPSAFWEEEEQEEVRDEVLAKYLDGTHCFDQICTELEMSERELTARLKRYPWEVLIIHR
ncbi:Nitrogen permease regulator 2 [Penicillium chrysogenum]|uniref:Nitrogen permease regulator 2 n=1 Tax=Penicillium chrysogenum TaxID=5076 RepID=UPI0024DF1165|nr:Nitrogen permease regulator 2 [Penicillium chrysogenum]KAJ5244352.1 Nitrogen permease regulator 2 [Penicillium chrysogenum]